MMLNQKGLAAEKAAKLTSARLHAQSGRQLPSWDLAMGWPICCTLKWFCLWFAVGKQGQPAGIEPCRHPSRYLFPLGCARSDIR